MLLDDLVNLMRGMIMTRALFGSVILLDDVRPVVLLSARKGKHLSVARGMFGEFHYPSVVKDEIDDVLTRALASPETRPERQNKSMNTEISASKQTNISSK